MITVPDTMPCTFEGTWYARGGVKYVLNHCKLARNLEITRYALQQTQNSVKNKYYISDIRGRRILEVEGSIMEDGVDQGQADDDDGNGPERERRELETAALMQSKNHLTTKELSRPHSYSAGEKLNRRASSPVMIRAGETLSLSTDKKNGGEGK